MTATRGDTATCASGCTIRDRHLPDCPCTGDGHTHNPDACAQCWGCVPALADTGSLTCRRCETRARRILDDLPDTYIDLAEPPSTTPSVDAGTRTSTETEACPFCDQGLECLLPHRETRSPIGEGQIEARGSIRATLVYWVKRLEHDHHITSPTEDGIAAGTRDIAHRASTYASAHRRGAEIANQPQWDPGLGRMLPIDRAAVTVHKGEEHRLTRLAEVARRDRETGRDIVAALADHVDRHLASLLRDERHAARVVHDLQATADYARRKQRHGRPDGVKIPCPCGATVRVRAGDVEVTCRGCGETRPLDAWRDVRQPMPLKDLPAWLATRGVTVTYQQLRNWADRGQITPISGGAAPGEPVAGRFNPEAIRLFAPEAVLLVATRRIPA